MRTSSVQKLAAAAAAALLAALAPASPAAAADLPKVIRLGFPGAGTGNRPISGGSPLGTAELQGLFEREFEKDGIKIEWYHFRQAGPAINESFANGLLDFSYEGDLGMIIGKAGGLRTRVLAGCAVRLPVSIAVPADSPVRSVADLKGKKVVIAKGTALQLAANRILAKFGVSEKDLRVVNIVGPGANDVLATKDADAAVSTGSAFYPLRDRGVARILYESPDVLIQGGFIGTDDFVQRYPEITRRVVRLFVQAARYSSDEANRSAVFKLWAQDGSGFGYYQESFTDKQTQRPTPLALRETPLLDGYWTARYREAISDALRYRLIRKDIDVDAWVDRRFLDEALRELGLERHWVAYGADGKPIS
jgi:sulfonate transport system substrate-binding protein